MCLKLHSRWTLTCFFECLYCERHPSTPWFIHWHLTRWWWIEAQRGWHTHSKAPIHLQQSTQRGSSLQPDLRHHHRNKCWLFNETPRIIINNHDNNNNTSTADVVPEIKRLAAKVPQRAWKKRAHIKKKRSQKQTLWADETPWRMTWWVDIFVCHPASLLFSWVTSGIPGQLAADRFSLTWASLQTRFKKKERKKRVWAEVARFFFVSLNEVK